MENKNLVITKCCIVCNEVKDLSSFSKLAIAYRKICKSCRSVQHTARDRTVKGLIRRIFTDQKANSRKRGHGIPSYSLTELEVWMEAQSNFLSLYTAWTNMEYLKDKRPSVDRLDDVKGYSLNNIRLITWGKNNRRNHKDKFKAVGTHTDLIEVYKYDKEGLYLSSYPSISIAARNVGLKSGASILDAIQKSNLASGFRWSKVKQDILKFSKATVKLDRTRRVQQFSTEGSIIKIWKNYSEIISGFNQGNRARSIEDALRGFTKVAYGFIWKYL